MAALGDTNISFPVSSSFSDPYVHQRVISQAASASLYVLTGSASSQLMLRSNPNRLAYIVVNDSPSICYVRYGVGPANSSNFTSIYPAIDLTAGTKSPSIQHEHHGIPVYTGDIHVAWASATGSMKITELT